MSLTCTSLTPILLGQRVTNTRTRSVLLLYTAVSLLCGLMCAVAFPFSILVAQSHFGLEGTGTSQNYVHTYIRYAHFHLDGSICPVSTL